MRIRFPRLRRGKKTEADRLAHSISFTLFEVDPSGTFTKKDLDDDPYQASIPCKSRNRYIWALRVHAEVLGIADPRYGLGYVRLEGKPIGHILGDKCRVFRPEDVGLSPRHPICQEGVKLSEWRQILHESRRQGLTQSWEKLR